MGTRSEIALRRLDLPLPLAPMIAVSVPGAANLLESQSSQTQGARTRLSHKLNHAGNRAYFFSSEFPQTRYRISERALKQEEATMKRTATFLMRISGYMQIGAQRVAHAKISMQVWYVVCETVPNSNISDVGIRDGKEKHKHLGFEQL